MTDRKESLLENKQTPSEVKAGTIEAANAARE